MADFSYSSILGMPPAKRKRFTIAGSEESQSQVSSIKDLRITQGQALRLNCPTLCIRVGPPPEQDPDPTQPELAEAEAEAGIQESFYVHEYALTDSSPFFANAMKPEWASVRPDPRTIDLPEDDPAAFSLYMSWLYTRQLPILPSPTDTPSDEDESYHTLAYAYVLGERLLDTAFKNAISDAYVLYARGNIPNGYQASPTCPPQAAPTYRLPFATQLSSSPAQQRYSQTPPNPYMHPPPPIPILTPKRHYPSNEEIRILYAGTSETSPIRKLLVDIWCCRGKVDWLEHDDDLPKEFLVEVMRGLLKIRNGGDPGMSPNLSRPWKSSHIQYHEKTASG